jgi:hypothetical protein
MSANNDMVNIGTPERPIMVPEKSLKPETGEGREWWGAVAEGSVVLEDDVLSKLLELTKDEKK